ncbi:MAG: tyrosine--tRNA ligase [Candidatus Diapherotrites archaeon]|uniref:Tyrosine--tRNA ligase n=1 Tax=Candidatus Iainarchaeum sp. TaxID=3101447 RepID=A0A8T4L4M7_9ARCH|nr:tyrosine--tRNA ligase [Candidatus Diapherotrites archaeon]
MKQTPEERLRLVTRNTAEIITREELNQLLKTKERPVIYLGVSITGRPHVGYFVWATKVADFLKAGFKVKILLADVHGAMDNCPWEVLEKRFEYYNIVIKGMLKSAGADLTQLEIIKGSSFQLEKNYVLDLLKFSTQTTVHDALKAASEVVKMGDNPKVSGLIYPMLQALDEQYLDVDIQFGGTDQRKIMVFARENLPILGYRPRIELMLPLIPGLTQTGKMSSSEPNSKIDLLETTTDIKTKLNKAYCPEKQIEGNGVMALCQFVIMPKKEDEKKTLIIKRPEKFGGDASYSTYAELEKAFVSGALHPMDLKTAVASEIDQLVAPIRKDFEGKEKLIQQAYPTK